MVSSLTVKEMIIYVDVAIEKIAQQNKALTRENILEELSYLAYHCNKKNVMLKKNYKEEKFFQKINKESDLYDK